MKANKENFKLLCRSYYEFTGDSSVLNGMYWYQVSDSCKSTFIQNFWYLYHEVENMVTCGKLCRFPIYQNGKKLPYIINSLNLYL